MATGVPAAKAERLESGRRPRDAGVNLGIADRAVAADDRCHVALPGLCSAVIQNFAEADPALAVEAAEP